MRSLGEPVLQNGDVDLSGDVVDRLDEQLFMRLSSAIDENGAVDPDSQLELTLRLLLRGRLIDDQRATRLRAAANDLIGHGHVGMADACQRLALKLEGGGG